MDHVSDEWKTNSVEDVENPISARIGVLIKDPSSQGSSQREPEMRLPRGDERSDLQARALMGGTKPDWLRTNLWPWRKRMGRYDGNRVTSNDAKVEKKLGKRQFNS